MHMESAHDTALTRRSSSETLSTYFHASTYAYVCTLVYIRTRTHIQEHSVVAIRNISTKTSHDGLMVERGILAPLVALLRSPNEAIQVLEMHKHVHICM
jgi:hypothetical protein